jgi:sterol desaturase/sphingolipid hydroxylase (fatty acid hydroxylase superfamily)
VETDSNYGNVLSLYDRWLRTYTPPHRAGSVVYGLDDADPVRARSLAGLLSMPFRVVEAQRRHSAGPSVLAHRA